MWWVLLFAPKAYTRGTTMTTTKALMDRYPPSPDIAGKVQATLNNRRRETKDNGKSADIRWTAELPLGANGKPVAIPVSITLRAGKVSNISVRPGSDPIAARCTANYSFAGGKANKTKKRWTLTIAEAPLSSKCGQMSEAELRAIAIRMGWALCDAEGKPEKPATPKATAPKTAAKSAVQAATPKKPTTPKKKTAAPVAPKAASVQWAPPEGFASLSAKVLGIPLVDGDRRAALTKAPDLGTPVLYPVRGGWAVGFYTGLGKSGDSKGRPTARQSANVQGRAHVEEKISDYRKPTKAQAAWVAPLAAAWIAAKALLEKDRAAAAKARKARSRTTRGPSAAAAKPAPAPAPEPKPKPKRPSRAKPKRQSRAKPAATASKPATAPKPSRASKPATVEVFDGVIDFDAL